VLRWLRGTKNADVWKTESGVWALKSLPPWIKRKLKAHLREVDPEGYKETIFMIRSLACQKAAQKKIPMNEAVARIGMYVEQQRFMSEGITKFRFVQGEELLDVLATMRAAGYTTQEISEKTSISPEIINKVTPTHIARMRRNFNEAIVNAADQKVYHDVMADEIDAATMRAEKIASGRRKVEIDAAKAVGKLSGKGPLPSQLAETKKRIEERFGVGEKDITDEVEETT
jgi:hypothetical protein